WHLYDCTDWAANLFNCPTVAYSGEKDRQKQAADVMATAMKREGMTLLHLIGPGTGHAYHPQTKQEINRRIDRIVQRGREPTPSRVVFTTYTLRYNQALWLTVDGLNEHWKEATVDATSLLEDFMVKTKNVSALTLTFGPGDWPVENDLQPTVTL